MRKPFILFTLSLLFSFSAFAQNVHLESTVLNPEYMANTEKLNGVPMDVMRYNDYLLFIGAYAAGGDLFQQFVRFLFPISGREKRVMFLPASFWDPKKPRYKKLEWKRFESDHFDFYSYPEGQATLNTLIKYYEEEYDRNNRVIGLDSKFTKKIPVIFYQTRRDFEQTAIVDGPIPEGLGGLTEILSWRRVTFPFEGEWSKFEHVAKHEATHVFQIAKKAKKMPLWFIEGSAETNSIYWDADAEMLIRDAFLNGFFFHIQDLWQIEGSWLMYKTGNFICNIIWDEYGEEGFRKLFDNASQKSFDNNLQDSLGIDMKELDRKVQATLQQRYSHLLHREDVINKSKMIDEKKVLLASFERFYVSGGMEGSRNTLYVNRINEDGKVITKKIAEDKTFENESFETFQKGAFISKNSILYSVKKSAIDELRVIPYQFDEKEKKFTLGEEKKYFWENSVDRIQDPVLIGDSKVAFIGYQDGFSNLYMANLQTLQLEQITKGKSHYSDLDYSEVRDELIFSKEGERDEKRIFYNRDIFTWNVKTRRERQITQTKDIVEVQPRFSQDGQKILYVATPDGTYDIYMMNLESKNTTRVTQMNIGAKNPQWSSKGNIIFNSYKEVRPSIFEFSLSRLDEFFPKGTETTMLNLDDGKLTIPLEAKPVKKHDEPVLDGLYLVNERPVIRFQNRNYTAESIATLDHQIVLRTEEGLPNETSTKQEVLPRYFEIQGKQINSLKSSMVAEEGISDDIRKWADLQLNGRDIVQGWISQDHEKALLIVNNRLAAEYDSFKKKPEVSVFVYDQSQNHLEELKDGPIRSLGQVVQWVAFLQNNQIFLAVGEGKTGPFETYIYSQKKKTYEVLDREMFQFRVSQDSAKILWKNMGYSLMDSTQPEKLKEYSEVSIKDVKEKVESFEFNEKDQPVFFSYFKEEKKWIYTTYDPAQKKYQEISLQRTTDDNIQKVSISLHGLIAVQIESEEKKGFQQIWIWDTKQNTAMQLKVDGDLFYSLVFRKEYLTFFSSFYDSRPSNEYIWSPFMGEAPILNDTVLNTDISGSEFVYEGEEQLAVYNQDTGEGVVVDQRTKGYTLDQERLIYSAKVGQHFQISQYDLKTKNKKTLTLSPYNKWKPTLLKNEMIYIAEKNGKQFIETQDFSTGQTQSTSSSEYDVQDIQNRDGEIEIRTQRKNPERPLGPEHPFQPEYPTFLQSQPIHQTLRLQNLAAAAAYDGDAIRYFFSGYADNLFSDKGVFVNSMFLGDTKFATVGYSDLNSGLNVSYFYNLRDGIENMGIDIAKNIIFDRYRQLTPYIDLEYQAYSPNSSALNSFIDSSFDDHSYYLIKLGSVYSYDVTVWDRHGPADGSRLYFRAETGVDTQNPRFTNTDANIDVRVYNRILPRFGFAHRLAGGTSQGSIPNIYLVGGNISFRGVGFDDLIGQNYWVFSEDMRVPIFDFIGAKFFDPVDSVLGFFSRYFDVRAGIYTDVGATWMNEDDPDLKYSVGYFVNIPTLFGLIVRLNQGFLGEKKFGLWFGTNW